MSVYINGMEMPKSCSVCPLRVTVEYEEICSQTGEYVCQYDRADDCPIVPVPPHGRLIAEDDAIETAWMILRGLGYLKEENPKLEQTVREVFATAPAIEVE